MDEAVLFPSPNWFQVSVITASPDGWLVYGGPSKSLCVLEPLSADCNTTIKGNSGYKAHVISRAHPEKIVSVDFSPEWAVKKLILTGSVDGLVKQWSIVHEDGTTKIKTSLVHEVHTKEKEEVVGVGYSNEVCAVSVGSYGNIVKWDVNSNVVKTYGQFLRSFKPNCMRCSPHAELNIAVGTKQGVVFVIDLNGQGKILYKVRAHDEEIINLSWCPQYEVEVKKALKEAITGLAGRLARIRTEPDENENLDCEDKALNKSPDTEKDTAELSEKFCKNDDTALDQSPKTEKDTTELCEKASENNATALDQCPKPEKDTTEPSEKSQQQSQSINEEVVEEDDMFDIYKDHEADEFGHKKYQPEDIYVKVKKDEVQSDFLAECLKLKGDILKLKSEPEPSIEALVDALDNTHVNDGQAQPNTAEKGDGDGVEKAKADTIDNHNSVHIHRHLLATIGKHGSIRVWSKSGKLVSSGSVSNNSSAKNYAGRHRRAPGWVTLLWYSPDLLLIADGRSQLVECNPTTIDCKNKLVWRAIHNYHRRGLYAIISTAPKVLLPSTKVEDWPIWTVAQDRSVIKYSLKDRKVLSVRDTCGGYVYTAATCPYDARKIAASVGDGAVRVWSADTLEGDENALAAGHVTHYWQNVQGKVLTVAWHPTRENLLAFATAEARVGLIEASSKTEKPAKVLRPGLNSGVYGLCWGDGLDLYACGSGELVVYKTNNHDDMPTPVHVELEGKQWKLSEVKWTERALLVGSTEGAVAALTSAQPHQLIAAAFPYTKIVHSLEWHPHQVSESAVESPNKNLIATCALEKHGQIVILELAENGDGDIKLTTWKTLSGHKGAVLRVAWNPHREGILASTSQDNTVRVWDVSSGVCTSIFGGHEQVTLGVAWSGLPSMSDVLVSGGGDCCLRLWRAGDHPADRYIEPKPEATKKEKKKNKEKAAQSSKETELPEEGDDHDQQLAANLEKRVKGHKKFLFPIMHKEFNQKCLNVCKAMVKRYIEKNAVNRSDEVVCRVQNGADAKKDETNQISNANSEIENNETNGNKPDEETNAIENGVEKKEKGADDIGNVVNNKEDQHNGNKADEVATGVQNGDTEKTEEEECIFVKIFGSINEVNELLDAELKRHVESHNHESWIMVSIIRGYMDAVFQYAAQRDLVCPFLLSLAPCVSFKYWKDATQLYMAQIDRLVAKGEENKLWDNKSYGGAVFRKVATLLSIHDVKGAVSVLIEAQHFKEAYVLCRVRHMDSIAEETLQKWIEDCITCGALPQAAVCYLAKGDTAQAASVLAKTNKEEYLSLAAEIAKFSGQKTFADHIVQKTEQIKLNKESAQNIEETLQELPSRIELLLKENGAGKEE